MTLDNIEHAKYESFGTSMILRKLHQVDRTILALTEKRKWLLTKLKTSIDKNRCYAKKRHKAKKYLDAHD